ncbi:MAG: response regulator transcription factor [Gloeobacterales cyanobacterium]
MEPISVVLIEDHDLTRIGLRAGLQRKQTIKVIGEAWQGNHGLRLLETMKPDVAIVDIGLPDMDGIELTRKFRSSSSTSETKIVILTMHDSEDSVLAAFSAGADSYCMKDISIDQLTEAVIATYNGQAWIDPRIASIVLRQMRSRSEQSANKTVPIDAAEPEYVHLLESSPLTAREVDVLELIVAGQSNSAIAEKLYVTVGTVKTHVRNILSKLSADDRTQAAVLALRSGLIK